MGNKLILIIIGLGLLVTGLVIGIRFAGDNRATVVGDTSRYALDAERPGRCHVRQRRASLKSGSASASISAT